MDNFLNREFALISCYVQRDFVRIYLIFIAIALTACASTNEAEYASFRVGSDHFDSFQSTFERSLCADGREKIIISLSLNKSEKAELVRLAKLDIAEGNSGSGDLEKICVSSFPYEITVGVQGKTSTTTCFSPIGDDESRVAKFVYSLESVQKLPKSQCRFY